MAGTCFRVNSPDVINETIDGEAMILNLGTGCYYSARGCGAQAWAWLSTAQPVELVVERLEQLYDADPSEIRAAVDAFVAKLRAELLLVETEPKPAVQSDSSTPTSKGKQPFERPTIERFTDLQDLLLLDPVHEVDTSKGWPHTVDEAESGKPA